MAFFVDHFSSRDMHKLYSHFKDETIFLDIEVEHVTKDITVIGLYGGVDTKIMIKGKNLDISYLSKFLSHYKLIVTYNGSVFDIPFLKKRYPDLIPKVPVIDLRHMCSRAGYSGGLKQIEKELGICRTNPLVENLVGGDPYKLYRMWKGSGDEHYLRLLVEYNEEDLINLRPILHHLLKSVSR